MYFGVSKNIGRELKPCFGFHEFNRPQTKKMRAFETFLEDCQQDLFTCMKLYCASNGDDIDELIKNKVDFDQHYDHLTRYSILRDKLIDTHQHIEIYIKGDTVKLGYDKKINKWLCNVFDYTENLCPASVSCQVMKAKRNTTLSRYQKDFESLMAVLMTSFLIILTLVIVRHFLK
ncbi:hypothetical protein L4C34_01510 [Vibrio profundum]|uniref:hypothetical protein n=1 Tax=Vibrio profundum TaxID=2910247 RepID=UPI003D12FFD5